jgi:hypothetical protein
MRKVLRQKGISNDNFFLSLRIVIRAGTPPSIVDAAGGPFSSPPPLPLPPTPKYKTLQEKLMEDTGP